MGQMSWKEWHDTAEREAARTYGKNHASTFMAMRLIGPGLVLIAIGLAGYGAWWVWTTVGDMIAGAGVPDTGGFPLWTIPLGVVLLIGTGIVLKPNPARMIPLPLTLGVLLAVWIWLIGYLIGFIG